MPKILISDDNLPYLLCGINHKVGGATVQAYSWLKGYKQAGYDVEVISCNKIKNNSEIKIHFYKLYSKGILKMLFRAISCYRILKKSNPDIVFSTVAGLNTFNWGTLRKVFNYKYIQRISNDIVYESTTYKKKLGAYRFALSKIGIKQADLILCQNDYQLENIRKLVVKSIIMKLYNPFYFHCEKIDVMRVRRYIAWIGIFQYQKNLGKLYEIASKLPNYYFKIAGERYLHIDKETEKAIENLKKLENVVFVGFLNRKEIRVFLAEAICLLNTSRFEGFSNTYLEALSVGCPIITRCKTDPDNIVRENNLGITVERYIELPKAIKDLNHEDFVPEKLIEYVKKNHDPQILVNKIEKNIGVFYE